MLISPSIVISPYTCKLPFGFSVEKYLPTLKFEATDIVPLYWSFIIYLLEVPSVILSKLS